MTPLTWRFVTAGLLICVFGGAVMVLQQGVGEHPVMKGALLAGLGLGLVLTGLFHNPTPPPDERPRLFDPEE